MKFLTRHYKRLRISGLKVALVVIFLNILFVPQYKRFVSDGNNLFTVYLNDEYVGKVGKQTDVEKLLIEARREIAANSDSILFVQASIRTEGEEVIFGKTDSNKTIKKKMVDILSKSVHEGLTPAYAVKIGTFTVNLGSLDDVRSVLQAAVDKYDENHEYAVSLMKDPNRELNALTAVVVAKEDIKDENQTYQQVANAGFERLFDVDSILDAQEADRKAFEEFQYGLLSIDFDDSIEIVDAYLEESQITDVNEAIAQITADEEKNEIYEVKSGDTLSGISYATNIPIDKLVAMNEAIEDEKTMIRVGQEIIITNPEPPLSINRVEQEYVEEDYDADIVYVDNDDWYTNQKETLQQPSAGHRSIVAKVNYYNDKQVSREVIKEDIMLEAIPKIVERGTKTPPTYIKPISGGRMSSTFGGRKAPTKGASSNHKGIDWAIATGSSVCASSGGRVTKAGWAKGYGYVVYIQHPDGKETRYGHLSKVLVSVGQTVSQGDRIALSGNSGVSTGPHLHFEIRVNGTAVNPLKYLN